MAVIKRQEKIERASLVVKLPASLVETIKEYAAYANLSKDSVVEQSVQYAIAQDKEFMARHGSVVVLDKPTKRARRAASGGAA